MSITKALQHAQGVVSPHLTIWIRFNECGSVNLINRVVTEATLNQIYSDLTYRNEWIKFQTVDGEYIILCVALIISITGDLAP